MQEAPSHGKNIYGNLTAARHAPSKKVRYTIQGITDFWGVHFYQ